MREYCCLFFLPLLASCAQLSREKPEVLACDEFIKHGLMAPTTYNRVSTSVGDETITKDEYVLADGWMPNETIAKQSKKEAVNPAIRTIVIEYDARNAAGVPLRQTGMCQFAMSDYKNGVFQAADLKEEVKDRNLQNDVFALAPNIPDADRVKRGCCLHIYYEKYLVNKSVGHPRPSGQS